MLTNLIKMNLNRFLKTKVFYITALITVICFFVLSAVDRDLTGSFDQIYADFGGGGYLLIMVGIFSIVYSEEERKSGFLKNLLTTRSGKKNIFLAKIPVVFLYTVIMFLASMLAIKLGLLTKGLGYFRLRSAATLIIFTAFEILLHTIYGIAMMALYEISRNTIVPTVICIFTAGNFHGMILNALEETTIKKFPFLARFQDTYALSRNLIVTLTETIQELQKAFPLANVLIVSALGLVFYTVLGMLVFTKRDTI